MIGVCFPQKEQGSLYTDRINEFKVLLPPSFLFLQECAYALTELGELYGVGGADEVNEGLKFVTTAINVLVQFVKLGHGVPESRLHFVRPDFENGTLKHE